MDPPGLLQRMGVTSALRRREAPQTQQDLGPTEDSLTWKELGLLVNLRDPRARIADFTWKADWFEYSEARDLFCRFTYEYWNIFQPTVFRSLTGAPATLDQAMLLWSLGSVEERLNKREYKIQLIPSVDGLLHNVPPKSRDQEFLLKRTAFFPEPGVQPVAKSHWNGYYKHGYVKAYHEAIARSPDSGKGLRDSLDGIFRQLQVLPHNPGRPEDVRPLWAWEGQHLRLLLNSGHIQLADRRIRYRSGTGKEQRQRGANKMKSKAEIEVELMARDRSEPQKRSRAVYKSITKAGKQLMKGRTTTVRPSDRRESSNRQPNVGADLGEGVRGRGGRRGKPKNYRKPPTRPARASVGSDDDSPSGGGAGGAVGSAVVGGRGGRSVNRRAPAERPDRGFLSKGGGRKGLETCGEGGDQRTDFRMSRTLRSRAIETADDSHTAEGAVSPEELLCFALSYAGPSDEETVPIYEGEEIHMGEGEEDAEGEELEEEDDEINEEDDEDDEIDGGDSEADGRYDETDGGDEGGDEGDDGNSEEDEEDERYTE